MCDPVDEFGQILELADCADAADSKAPRGSRSISPDMAPAWNFSSNDDLGLADNEELKIAYLEHIGRYGGGSGASHWSAERWLPTRISSNVSRN